MGNSYTKSCALCHTSFKSSFAGGRAKLGRKLFVLAFTTGYLHILKHADWPRPEDGCLV